MSSHGQIIVHCVSARNLYSADLIKSQDPYLQLILAGTTLSTKAHKRGGTSPHWDQSLVFPIDPANPPQFLNIACFDKDTLTADDLIGQAAVSLPAALGKTGAFDGWIQLSRGKLHGKPAGEVHLQIRYETRLEKEREQYATGYRSSSSSSISESEGYYGGHASHDRHHHPSHPPIPSAAEPTGGDPSSRGKSCKVGGAIVGIGTGAVALAGAAMDKWGEHKMKKMEKKAKKKHGFLGGFNSGFKQECGNSAGEAFAPESDELVSAVTEGVVGGIVESVLGGLFGE